VAQREGLKRGVTLDIGKFPEGGAIDTDEDPTRLVSILAHAVARLGDRLPFTRKISRHMEGTENKAGIIADILALLTELASRNTDIIEARLANFGDDLAKARAKRNSKANQAA
jgi:hypothetical protein